MGWSIKDFVDHISKAANARDFPAVNHHMTALRDHLYKSGTPVDDDLAYTLIDTLVTTSTYESKPHIDLHNPYSLIEKIVRAAGTRATPEERAEIRVHWNALHVLLANPGIQVDGSAVEHLVGALKNTGEHFDLLGMSADRFIARGQDSAQMRVHYAQALIDSGQPVAAIHVLESVLPNGYSRFNLTTYEHGEVHGLLGRAHKQIFINHVSPKNATPHAREKYSEYLLKAIAYYGKTYDPATPGKNYYQGINYIALLALADRHGIRRDAVHDPRKLAQNMLNDLEVSFKADADVWTLLSMGEAHIAAGNNGKALKYYKMAADHPNVTAFKLGSAMRQIDEIWLSENDDQAIRDIEFMLKERMANMKESSVSISAAESKEILQAHSKNGEAFLERHIPGGDQIPISALYRIVERAKSIAKIMTSGHDPFGTGFLVKGSDINSEYHDEVLLLTNAHVVWDKKLGRKQQKIQQNALSPGNAIIQFQLDNNGEFVKLYKCAEVVWQSPSAEHDACLMRLNQIPPDRPPLSISWDEPKKESNPGLKDGTPVAVIGHPKGGTLSVGSMGSINNQNGHIVDVGPRRAGMEDPKYIHYRIPTEKGNSGSPVFDTNEWKVIALHHAGYHAEEGRQKLNGISGQSFANEGILISSLCRAISSDMSSFTRTEIRKRAKNLKINGSWFNNGAKQR